MIVRELQIDGFGCLVDQRFKLGDGLTVIFGPNESGKTTLVECLVRLLFGYPEHMYGKLLDERRPWKAPRFSASLIYALDDGREFETRRDFSHTDVPTQTTERAVMRPVADLSGTRKASPGATLLSLSLEAYEAAAVIRAGEFAFRPDAKDEKALEVLAERIAAVVGSAGETGAASAIDRLDAFAREIGSDRVSSKPLSVARVGAQGAREELERYRRDADEMRHDLATRAALASSGQTLAKRASELTSSVASAQLGTLRKHIAEAESADKGLTGAVAERSRIVVSPEMLERAKRIDTATDDWRSAKAAEAAATTTSEAKEPERTEELAQLKQCGDKISELEATIKRNSEAIERLQPESGSVRVSKEALDHLEALSDQADQLEATARKKETQARVTRSRSRPGALVAFCVIVLALVALGIGAVAHVEILIAIGLAGMIVGAALLAVFLIAQGGRNAAERSLEAAAANARAAADKAEAQLAGECAALKLSDIRAARRAHSAQSEIERFSQARAAAEELAVQTRKQQTVLEARLNEIERATQTLSKSRQRSSDCEAALQRLLDDVKVERGALEQRIEAFRKARTDLELALKAEHEVGGYREARASALGGQTLDDLRAQAARLERSGVQPADGDVGALQAELNDVATKQRANELEAQRISGELKAFDQRYAGGGAPLEERLAACELEEARLNRARDAAVTARDAIEQAKDKVHKDFAPHLNALAGPAIKHITGGRYAEVAVDPRNFAVRVRTPERGEPVEMSTLSSGTQEQLTLVLRAATAQALGSGERVPLLLDDALAHADENRRPAAVRQLHAIAQHLQVLLLTQHAGIVGAARELDGVTIIELSGPAAGAAATKK